MIIFGSIILTFFFGLIGCIFSPLSWLNIKNGSLLSFCYPGIGICITTFVCVGFTVFTGQYDGMLTIFVLLILSIIGIYSLVQYLSFEFLFMRLMPGIAAASLIASAPLALHLAPPDVDAAAYGFYSFLIKSGQNMPYINPWGITHSFKALIPPTGLEYLVALFSKITNIDLAKSLIIVACSSVSAVILIGFSISYKLISLLSAPLWILFASIPLILNRAYIWEYGDGSFNRVPATVGIFLCAILVSQVSKSKKWQPALLLGFFNGIILYFHYRFFIWNCAILIFWFVYKAIASKKINFSNVFLFLITTLLTIAPLLWQRKDIFYQVLSFHKPGDMIPLKHELSWVSLLDDLLRFQGVGAIFVLCLGLLVAVRNWKKIDDLIKYGCVSLIMLIFFSIDKLVLFLLPFTYNFLYSQVAIIYNNSIPKIILGIYLFSLLFFALNNSDNTLNKSKIFKYIRVIILFSALTFFSYELFREFLITPPIFFWRITLCVSLAFLIFALLSATLTLFIKNIKDITKYTLITIIFLYSSNEFRLARFNYPYITPGDREAFLWLRENTSQDVTLVLSQSMHDLNERDEKENFQPNNGQQRSNSFSYSYYWLSAISERYSVFNRGNFLDRYLHTTIPLSGSDPDLLKLDWAFFNIDKAAACEIMKANKVTHVYFEAAYHTLSYSKLINNSCLKRVFESKNELGINPYSRDPLVHGAAIYEIK